MSFFDNSSVEDLAQSHVEQVQNLNEKEVKKIISIYKGVRLELMDRLSTMPAGTFTSQRMRGVLVQVDLALEKMTEILGDGIKQGSLVMGEFSADNLIEEINKWDNEFTGAITPLNLDAALAASKTSNFLFERHSSSLKAYSQALRQDFAIELTEAALVGRSSSDVFQGISRKFKGEEWKLERIARTELHNVYNLAKIENMKELRNTDVPDLLKTLFHPMDSRTASDSKKLNRENPKIAIDKPFKFKWKDQERVFMAPPDRPNDRAILLPYRESWK